MSDSLPTPAGPTPSKPAPPIRPTLRTRCLAWFARLGRSLAHGVGPGAILDKELRIQGRRVSTYWVRFAYGVLMALFVGLTLANVFTRTIGAQGGPATLSSIESLQTSGPTVLLALAWMQFIGTSLASAIFTSPLICEERRAGTLGTLLVTPLTAWQIVVGKACGALVQLLILGLMGLPVLLGVRVFGGISGELVVHTIAVLAGTTIGCCALGILASTLSQRQSGAVASAIVFTLMWYVGPPLVGAAIQAAGVTPPWATLLMFSPGAAMVELVARLEGHSVFGPTPIPIWAMMFLCALAVALMAFLLATFRLRSLMRQVAAGREAAPGKKTKGSPTDQAQSEPVDEAPESGVPMTRRERRRAIRRARVSQLAGSRAKSRTVGDQPVLWRELRQPMATRRWVAWLSGFAATAVLAYTFWASDDGQMVSTVVAMIGLVISVMIVSGTAGSALGQERESRSWETLLSTPLSAGQILIGKLAGVLFRLRIIWLFVVGTIIISAVGWETEPILLLHMVMLLVTTSFFVGCVGLFFGSVTRRSMVAIVASLASILGIWLVLPVATMMCVGLSGRDGEEAASVVAATNPFAWAAVTIAGARDHSWREGYSYTFFSWGELNALEFTFVLGVFCAIYVGLGAVLLTAARNALAASTLRAKPDEAAIGPGNVIAG